MRQRRQTNSIAYFTKDQLRAANNEATSSQRQYTLAEASVEGLPERGLFPIKWSFQPHADLPVVRCILLLSDDGNDAGMLDVHQDLLMRFAAPVVIAPHRTQVLPLRTRRDWPDPGAIRRSA